MHILCETYFGNYKEDPDNIVLHFVVTFENGKKRIEKRYTKSNKKGLAKTSLYGQKVIVNLNTLEVTLANEVFRRQGTNLP